MPGTGGAGHGGGGAIDGGQPSGDGSGGAPATGGPGAGGAQVTGERGTGGTMGGQSGGQFGSQPGGKSDGNGGTSASGTGGRLGAGGSVSRGTGGGAAGRGVGGIVGSGGPQASGTGGAGTGGRVVGTGGAAAVGGRAGSGGVSGSGGMTMACGQAPVALGTAGDFVVLAGSTITSTGLTLVTGDLGVSPGTAVTGFPPGVVVGLQHAGDPTATQGEAVLTTAYNDAAGRTLCPIAIAGNLGGMTLPPGLYKSTSSLEISSGNLTLDAAGDASAVWIFQMASTMTTTTGRQVILSGGARASRIFWQVGTSATLGSTSVFQGTVMADQSITLVTGATLNGRALARIGAVTLDSSSIVKPAP
jgi:Ice-binding-like